MNSCENIKTPYCDFMIDYQTLVAQTQRHYLNLNKTL